MLVPVYGFIRGDTLGVLVLVQDTDTIATLSDSLAQAGCMRVPPFRGRIHHAGKLLAPTLTVAAAGLQALDRVDLVPEVP